MSRSTETAFTGDSVAVSKLSLGPHTIVVEARDIAGNRTTKTETFTVTGPVQDSDSVSAPGTVGGAVPATLALSLGAPATFGAFTPGVTQELHGAVDGEGDLDRGRRDAVGPEPGHLTNGAFSLAEPLRVTLAKSSWTGPATNEDVASRSSSRQGHGPAADRHLHATVTFTLSTTTP